MYWEQPPDVVRAPYLDLCIETVQRNADGLDLKVVDQDTIFEVSSTVDRDNWSLLRSIPHRADYARTHLIYEYGGLWLDVDCLVMRPLSELLEVLDNADVAGWGTGIGGNFSIGMFAARPGASLIHAWLTEQERVVNSADGSRQLGWTALGADIMTPLSQQFHFVRWPTAKVAPVPYWEWRRFTSRLESPRRVLAHQPDTVMLYNKLMSRYFGGLSRSELLGQRTLLSRLFRIALGITSPADELDAWVRLDPVSRLRFTRPGTQLEHWIRLAAGERDPWTDA
jgi:hypothetical protein